MIKVENMPLRTIFLTSLIAGILLFGFFFLSNNLPEIKAGPNDNVYGWSWSSNVGWSSFNCYNYYGNDPENLVDRCSTSNYGVNITPQGDKGIFAGYAWSPNIGWISFNRAETGPPPGQPNFGTHLAEVDLITIPGGPACALCNVYGWARALSAIQDPTGGWDGWIKLRCYGSECNNSNYGVAIEGSPLEPPPSRIPEFVGWAWGSEVVGWMSFNCRNGGICATSNYKVLVNWGSTPNQPPTATNLTATENYCGVAPGRGQVSLGWTYNDLGGDPQEQYHLQIASNGNFNNTSINCIVNQSVNPGGPGSSALNVVSDPQNACNDGGELGGRSLEIVFGPNYHWRLKVKDDQGNWSADWVSGPNFNTPAHAYPWVDFNPPPPSSVGIEELVQYADQSTCYPGSTTCDAWFWTFPPDWEYEESYGPSSQSPLGQFTVSGEKDVTLRATDGDGFSCQRTKQVNSRLPLPEWREISPFQ